MKDIVIDTGINDTRIALTENNELVEIYIERYDNKKIVGNIYKGIVENVFPGMQAAFVDIGLEKNAFLYIKDVLTNSVVDEDFVCSDIKINDLLKKGQEVIVQVVKESMDTKGARVTTQITLPGRYVVLMPTVDYVGVSRRIESEEERVRLKMAAQAVKPDKMGLIVRTVGQDRDESDFLSDIEFLTKLWDSINQKSKSIKAPALIHNDLNIIQRTLRDLFTKEIDSFVINDGEEYEKVVELTKMISPHLTNKVFYYNKNTPIFEHYKIEAKLSKLISNKVWLENGGYIVIDKTEALTSIDVNTGKYVGTVDLRDTVLKTNIEAAREIAKQLRLRDIGGIIIIDFIDMSNEEHKNLVLDVLKNALKKDRTKTSVFGITQLGLVEMTRKKVRQRVESTLLTQCPYCKGSGKVQSFEFIIRNIEREIISELIRTDIKAVRVKVNCEVLQYLISEYSKRIDLLEKKYDKKIIIDGIEDLHREEYKIEAIEINQIIDK